MIVYNVREVVGRIAIRLNEDLVINDIVIEDDLAMNEVLPFTDSMRHKHPDNVLFSTRQTFFDL